MTQAELAAALGVDTRSVGAYERGEFSPDENRLHAISTVLAFPLEFFLDDDDLEEIPAELASFRSRARMTASKRDQSLASGAIALQFNEWMELRFELPVPELPDLSEYCSAPDAAAWKLREMWGLGILPIRNMIHLIESKGVRVFSLSIESLDVDAYSLWIDGTPFAFLNSQKTSEHGRFDAAHELAHLVLHRNIEINDRALEKQANCFAAAFLMPAEGIRRSCTGVRTVNDILSAKRAWLVSAMAMARRLKDVGLLTSWQYRSACEELSARGFRKSEPDSELPRENSMLLNIVFGELAPEKITRSEIASHLNVSSEELDQLVFGLTLTVLEGSRGRDSSAESSFRRPVLKLVKRD